jgi:hypothetical protein
MNFSSAILFQSVPGPANNLVDACRKGDHRAQLQVYKIYYKLIFKICLQIIPDQTRAEEVMHEVILDALEEVMNCQGNAGFSELLSKSLEMILSAELCGAGSTATKN